jgi:hypothetical protein
VPAAGSPPPHQPLPVGEVGIYQGSPVGPLVSGMDVSMPPFGEAGSPLTWGSDPTAYPDSPHPSAEGTPGPGPGVLTTVYDSTGEVEVIYRFFASGVQTLKGFDALRVQPKVWEEIRHMGVAAIRWSQPVPVPSSDEGDIMIYQRYYPPRFDAASAEAGRWTSELRG